MKVIIPLFLILILSLLQTTLLPINFLLILVIVFSLWQKAPESFLWVFLAGFFLDLFSFHQLGFSALIFVSFDFVLKLYRQRFSLDHPLVISLVILISYWLYSWLTDKPIILGEIIILLIFILLTRFLKRELFLALSSQEGGRLKL